MNIALITLEKSLIIEEGLNLNGDEADLVQEIGINQYTEKILQRRKYDKFVKKTIDKNLQFFYVIKYAICGIILVVKKDWCNYEAYCFD